MTKEAKKKKWEFPHGYLILMTVMLIVVVLSWIIPPGEYARVIDSSTGMEIVDPDTFQFVEQDDPIGFFDFFTAINAGIVKAMGIGSLIVVMTGAIAILDSTGALTTGVKKIIEKSKGKEFTIVAIFLLLFVTCGVVGLAENMMPFIPIIITLVMGLGYDRMVGITVLIAGLEIGWTAGIVNIYTTGISQEMIGLPIFSGLGFRTIATIIFYIIAVAFLYRYCKKIKKEPSKSIVADEYLKQCSERKENIKEKVVLTIKMKLGLAIFGIAMVIQTYGAVKLAWSYDQMSAVLIIAAILIAIVCGINANNACRIFTKGASELLSVVFMMGLAQAVTTLMKQAKMLDTIVYYLSQMLQNKGMVFTLLMVFVAVMILNFFIISGEGKAIVMIPILSPLAKILGINQQVVVLAYQYAEGFTNDLYPTYGSLHAMLAMGKVSFGDWWRFTCKLWFILLFVGFILVLIAQGIHLGPF